MAKDGRALREEAAEATAAGKYKRALAAYLELERIEPRDAQWAKRAAETYKRLGNTKSAIDAYERSADRYAQNGFLVQAIAVCKLVLQIDPNNQSALNRLSQMNEEVGAGPSRAQSYADNNPELHANPNVAMLRRVPGQTLPPPVEAPKRNKPTTPPVVPIYSRTKSKPIALPLGSAIEQLDLAKEVPDSQKKESAPGVTVIAIDDEELLAADEITGNAPVIEVEPPDSVEAEIDDVTELALDDVEEIPLPEPRAIGARAQRALAATPLFAGLPAEALEALVSHLSLVPLEAGIALFKEGDPGDALYVIVEGEVSVQAEGPPRVEMARLGPGSFIGEVALMTDQPRSATVTATVPSELLRIDRHTLSRVLADHGDVLRAVLRFVRERLVDRWMRTSPLFRPFNDEQRNALAARFKFLEIEANTKLLAAGQRPDGLYITLAGTYSVERNGALVATVGPGELIGETALLSGGTFRSDVISRGKGLALCLPAQEFREVIMTHPHVLEYIGEHAEQSRRLQIL
ncbi:MAG: cyclic nucleotide-binding domain-containing protein [Deltaproteobacteria bacterium]|nr:cyclic nucleotide-binding domain-containing protein [Deltaproteobacteria bacterium]